MAIIVGNLITRNGGGTNPLVDCMTIAFFLGVFGFVVAHRLTTSLLRTRDLASTVPVEQQERTLSLCLACLVPAAAGLAMAGFLLVANALWEPPDGDPSSLPVTWFGDYPAADVLAVVLAMGPAAALGGPLLGVAVARWAPFRGSALLGVVVLVVASTIPASDGSGDPCSDVLRLAGAGRRARRGWEDRQLDDRARDRAALGAGLGPVPMRARRRGGPPA